MRMIRQSAEVLNEADVAERRMNWVLFQYENEAVVYGDGTGWQPGVPLHRHPWMLDEGQGNYVRPLIQVFDEGDDTMDSYIPVRCEPCDVTWLGEDPCFVCGTQYAIKKLQFPFGVERATISRLDREEALVYNYEEAADDIIGWMRRSMRVMLDAELQRAMSDVGESTERAARSLAGLNDQMVTYSAIDAIATNSMYAWQTLMRSDHQLRGPLAHFQVDSDGVFATDVESRHPVDIGDGMNLSFEFEPIFDVGSDGIRRITELRNRSTMLVYPRRQGRSALMRIFDELNPELRIGARPEPDPEPEQVEVTVDGHTISIPNVPIPTTPPFMSVTGVGTESIERAVERHRGENPHYYNRSPIPPELRRTRR